VTSAFVRVPIDFLHDGRRPDELRWMDDDDDDSFVLSNRTPALLPRPHNIITSSQVIFRQVSWCIVP
jgi:hypothetical protein